MRTIVSNIRPNNNIQKVNIARQNNLQSQKSLCEALTTYADTIAHDQRSPICSINLANSYYESIIPILADICAEAQAHKLKSTKLITPTEIEELYSWAEVIRESTTRMTQIIDNSLKNIRCAIKVHNGHNPQDDFTICDIINDNLSAKALKMLFLNIDQNIIHIDIKHTFKYLGNKISMDQIISNLIQNALYQIKLNGHGEIFITTTETKDHNLLKIKDTAGGASPSVVKKMFDSHFTTKPEGNGVGLDFCKRTIEIFGGNIIAKSKLGEYMEITIALPKI